MTIDKVVNVLYFEDDPTSQKVMCSRLRAKFGAKVTAESTLTNIDIYVRTGLVAAFDLIICDYCFKAEDLTPKLKYLAQVKQKVIFNTCLDWHDWHERVSDELGRIPSNFTYTQKANYKDLERLDRIMESLSCD